MSIPSSPPSFLPQKDKPTGPFDKWLYDFWVKVNAGTSDGDQNVLAIRAMLPHYTIPPTVFSNDTQSILANQIFGA